MTRLISLNARTQLDAAFADTPWVFLFEFTHPELPAPMRFSTDPTTRITTDPLIYGTRSPWRGTALSDHWTYVGVNLVLPSDSDGVPAALTVALDVFDSRIVRLLRSFRTRATVNLGYFMASDMENPEAQYLGLELLDAGHDTTLTLSTSRKRIEQESAPMDRIIKQYFPGLVR